MMARKRKKPISKSNKQVRGAGQKVESKASSESFVLPESGSSSSLTFDLAIQLKSDFCPGSGDGFSSGVDQDVCFSTEGLPYVSGRRIKGCLREAAVDIGVQGDLIDTLFGVSGNGTAGALSISSASIDEAVTTGGVSATVGRYTYTRAQTKIDRTTGSVADGTLRFIRVVKHYGPDGDELRFISRVTLNCGCFTSDDERDEAVNQLRRCVRALRNMGMERNRGLGAVRCNLRQLKVDTREHGREARSNAGMVRETSYGMGISKGMTSLSYKVWLDDPLMLPQENGNQSHACIPGASVLGSFASKLSNRFDFDELFFGGKVRFSPLYPLDAEGELANRCLPASPFIVKAKGGEHDGEYYRADELGGDVTAKPIKEGYLSPATWQPVKVDTEIVYHHSTVGDGTLYTQECLSSGQTMAGFVECPTEWAPIFMGVLAQGDLSFGRSKSAQYGHCSLRPCDRDLSGLNATIDIDKGKRYVLLLESDALVVNELACPSTAVADLVASLRRDGVVGDWLQECDVDDSTLHSFITNLSSHAIGGYNAKWNQKKAHVCVIDAGSCLAFTAASSANGVPAVGYTGERQAEGCGRVRIIRLADVHPHATTETGPSPQVLDDNETARLTALRYADEVRGTYFSGRRPYTSSFISRLTMMVDESVDAPAKSFEQDLEARIDSIKDNGKRTGAFELVHGLEGRLGDTAWRRANWRLEKECLMLVLTLGKYYQKQATASGRGVR